MNITVTNSDFRDVDIDGCDTLIFDPDYDSGFYSNIPRRTKYLRNAIVWTQSYYLAQSIITATNHGWDNYRGCVIWDGVSSWYIPGRMLLRDNIALIFSDSWDQSRAIIPDGKYRPARKTRNSRGGYLSSNKSFAQMSSVYQMMRSTFDKSHPYEKPWQIIGGILAAIRACKVVDLFMGSGSGMIGAHFAECESYIGNDLNNDFCKLSQNNYGKWQHSTVSDFLARSITGESQIDLFAGD